MNDTALFREVPPMGEEALSHDDQALYSQLHSRFHKAIERVRQSYEPDAARALSRVLEQQESAVRSVLAASGIDNSQLHHLLADLDELTRAMREAVQQAKSADRAVLTEADARRELERRTVSLADDYDEPLLSSDEFAALTGARARQTVHNWRAQGRIIGWQRAKRGFVYPKGQLDERGRPLPGLDRVLELFDGDAFMAWEWLRTPLNATDGRPPLDLLRQGDAELVVRLARGHREGAFD